MGRYSTYWHRNQRLVAKRESQLNAVGFVWGRRDWLWERAFTALKKFKMREGHCLVHSLHVEDGINLGYWVSVQRRRKNKMSHVRKRRLEELGFVWLGKVPMETMRRLRPDRLSITRGAVSKVGRRRAL